MSKNLAPGVRATSSGWQVYLRRKGVFLSQHFKPDTDLITLKEARKNLEDFTKSMNETLTKQQQNSQATSSPNTFAALWSSENATPAPI